MHFTLSKRSGLNIRNNRTKIKTGPANSEGRIRKQQFGKIYSA